MHNASVRFSFLFFFIISTFSYGTPNLDQRTSTPYKIEVNNYRSYKQDSEDNKVITVENIDSFISKNEDNKSVSNSSGEPKPEEEKVSDKLQENKKQDLNTSIFSLRYDIAKLSGDYRSVKLFSVLPISKINFSASEARPVSSTQQQNFDLFNGYSSVGLSPGLSLAIGYEFQKYYSFEVELQYMYLNSKVQLINNTSPDSVFDISSKVTSFSIFSLFINNHLRADFFEGKIEAFIGIGIGIGYAMPKETYFVNPGIILPAVMMEAGVTIGASEKTKVSLFWRGQYMNIKLTNRTPFVDTTGKLPDLRPMESGQITLNNIFINMIGVGVKFS